MTDPASTRVGWCPGALRPMETGDGLVLRIKPHGGALSLEQGGALAALAMRFGNGDLDLTARANLQIRGVSPATLDPALTHLAALGLLDPDAETEAIRNVVASPLAGLDPDAVIDIRPIVAALEQRLVRDETLRGLPAKWSIVIDDGGSLALTGVAADLRFVADPDGSMRVALAGSDLSAPCSPDGVSSVTARLARAVLGPEPRRMGDLVRERGAASLFAEAGLLPVDRPAARRLPTRARDAVGLHRLGASHWLGVAAPFGHARATDLTRLIGLAREAGAVDLRLTPWRSLLLTGLEEANGVWLERQIAGGGFVIDPDDPRLAMAACSGAPACHRGTTPVRDHAGRLAGLIATGAGDAPVRLHVSGCSKGCSHGHPAPWTLVGHEGLYDIVRDGRAGDAPVARGLSFQEAASWLSRSLDGGAG